MNPPHEEPQRHRGAENFNHGWTRMRAGELNRRKRRKRRTSTADYADERRFGTGAESPIPHSAFRPLCATAHLPPKGNHLRQVWETHPQFKCEISATIEIFVHPPSPGPRSFSHQLCALRASVPTLRFYFGVRRSRRGGIAALQIISTKSRRRQMDLARPRGPRCPGVEADFLRLYHPRIPRAGRGSAIPQ